MNIFLVVEIINLYAYDLSTNNIWEDGSVQDKGWLVLFSGFSFYLLFLKVIEKLSSCFDSILNFKI